MTDARVLARHFVDVGRPDRALDALEGAEPCDAELFLLRSHASRELGDAPAAEAVYAQLAARDLQLEKADALLALARAVDAANDTVVEVEACYAYARGDRRRAAAAARRLLAREPDSELAHTILGGLAWTGGAAATATRHLDAAVRADPRRSPLVDVAREARVEAADPFLRGLYRIDRLWFWVLALGLLFATPFVPFLAVVTVPVLLLAVGVGALLVVHRAYRPQERPQRFAAVVRRVRTRT